MAPTTQWNLAWQLTAGLAYQVTPNLTIEAAYRYINLGNAQSGDLIAYDGTNTSTTRWSSATSLRTTSRSASATRSAAPDYSGPPSSSTDRLFGALCEAPSAGLRAMHFEESEGR